MYSINWHRSITELLQNDARRPIWIAWLYALVKPLVRLANEFEDFRELIISENRWNGTTASLSKMLNDKYDPILRRIKLYNVVKKPLLFYRSGNEKPDAYYQEGEESAVYHYRSANEAYDLSLLSYELIVRVHAQVVMVPEEMLELIERYRYAGIRPRLFRYGIGLGDIPIDTTFTFNP